MNINFDTELLAAQSVALGAFLGSSGRTIFPLQEEIDNENGIICYAITTLGQEPPGTDGEGMLLDISWIVVDEIEYETQTQLVIDYITHRTRWYHNKCRNNRWNSKYCGSYEYQSG